MENLETIAYPYIIIDFSESTDVECKVYSLPEIDALLRKIDSKPVANPDRDYKKIRYRLIIKEDIELADSFFLGYGECGILKRIGTLPMFKEYIDLISISLNGSYDKELGISPYMATFYENGERVTMYADSHEKAINSVIHHKRDVRNIDRCYCHEFNDNTGKYEKEGIYQVNSYKNITSITINIPIVDKNKMEQCIQKLKAYNIKYHRKSKTWSVPRNTSSRVLEEIDTIIDSFVPYKTFLELPTLEKSAYSEIIKKIKEDGAKFDSKKKLWYITTSCDTDKFKKYLPQGRSSVTSKLEKYRKGLENPK